MKPIHLIQKTILLIWLVVVCTALTAADKPVKIAVMGSPSELGKEIDLLTVEFTNDDSLNVLSRSEWTKLTREYEILKQDTASAYSKFGQISGADALIILQQSEIKGKKDIIAKLVTTKTGLIIDALLLPKSSKEMSWVAGLKKYFTRKLAKLAKAKDSLPTMSLLNIRAETSGPELLKLEKQLNALYSYRLKRNKNVLVTERENMQEVLFEKYLNKGDEAEFKTGKVVVDGSFKLSGDQVVINFRVKKADGKIASFKISENKKKIAKIADQLVDRSLKIINSKANKKQEWNQKKEAQEYLEEAIWAYNCGLYDIAAQASEAAWALGCRDRKITPLRILSYAFMAYPIFKDSRYRENRIDVSQSDKNLNSAIIAIDLLKRHFIAEVIKKKTPPNAAFLGGSHTGHWMTVANTVIKAGTYVSRSYYDQRILEKDQEKLTYLKKLLRDSAQTLRNHTGKIGRDIFRVSLNATPYWYDEIQEMKQECKSILLDSRKIIGNGAASSMRGIPSPLFIDWKGNLKDGELVNTHMGFIRELCKSEQPQLCVDGAYSLLRFRKKGRLAFDKNQQIKAKALLTQTVSNNIEKIHQKKLWLKQHAFGKNGLPEILAFQIYQSYLKHLSENSKLTPENHLNYIIDESVIATFSPSQLEELNSLLKKIDSDSSRRCFKGLFKQIQLKAPKQKASKSDVTLLKLKNYWMPPLIKGKDIRNQSCPWGSIKSYNNKIYTIVNRLDRSAGKREKFLCELSNDLKLLKMVKLKFPAQDLKAIIKAKMKGEIAKYCGLPFRHDSNSMTAMSVSEKYVAVTDRYNNILLYARNNLKLKQKLTVPDKYIMALCLGNNVLYGFYECYVNARTSGKSESGIVVIHLDNDKIDLLCSSRKKPPECVLDSRTPSSAYQVIRLDSKLAMFRFRDKGKLNSTTALIKDGKIMLANTAGDDFYDKYLVRDFTLNDNQNHCLVFKTKESGNYLCFDSGALPSSNFLKKHPERISELSQFPKKRPSDVCYFKGGLVTLNGNKMRVFNSSFPHGRNFQLDFSEIAQALKKKLNPKLSLLDIRKLIVCDGKLFIVSNAAIIALPDFNFNKVKN